MSERDDTVWDHRLEDPNGESPRQEREEMDAMYTRIGEVYGDRPPLYPSLLRAALTDLQPDLLMVPKKPDMLSEQEVANRLYVVSELMRKIETSAKDIAIVASSLFVGQQLRPQDFDALSPETQAKASALISLLDLEQDDPRYAEFFEKVKKYVEKQHDGENS